MTVSTVSSPTVPSPVAPPAPPTAAPGPFRSPAVARLLDEQERRELDRRVQEALERQGAVAGQD